MTLGDLISAIKTKAGSMFESSNDTTATQNLPALQARYQMYAADEMAAGRGARAGSAGAAGARPGRGAGNPHAIA